MGRVREVPVLEEPPQAELVLKLPSPAEFNEEMYRVRHINLQLTDLQARGLRRLYDSLHLQAAKLETGRHVQGPPDAIKWALEEISKAYQKL